VSVSAVSHRSKDQKKIKNLMVLTEYFLIPFKQKQIRDVSMEYVKVSRDIFEPIRDLVKIGLYRDEREALRSLVQDQAKHKVEHYNKKIAEMEKKYMMTFSDFNKNIHAKTDEEVFEEWDDFILWESYIKARQYWEKLA
jgi:hypothetical protein